MSERKVLNKYYPPDFDPSKIRRRKGINAGNPQITIRLMAPFSMRCSRCGEYIYKGKKFNARKETAMNEEYYGIKVFRFYIKCPVCSSEITFKTDPKNADYICEHGATRNFENWAESDPNKRVGAMPDAAADDQYDSDGNLIEDAAAAQRDAMADLERSQEQSRREMEMMDELADLRQRNARLELSGVGTDPEALLSALHAERQSAEEEARKKMEQEEDDQLVAQYFAKVNAGSAPPGAVNGKPKDKGKGKAKAVDGGDAANGDGAGAEENGADYGPEAAAAAKSDDDSDDEGGALPSAALTIKRRPAPTANGNGSNGSAEPSVASILAAKGKALDPATANGSGAPPAPAVVKRKREDMQKLLGIKKKK